MRDCWPATPSRPPLHESSHRSIHFAGGRQQLPRARCRADHACHQTRRSIGGAFPSPPRPSDRDTPPSIAPVVGAIFGSSQWSGGTASSRQAAPCFGTAPLLPDSAQAPFPTKSGPIARCVQPPWTVSRRVARSFPTRSSSCGPFPWLFSSIQLYPPLFPLVSTFLELSSSTRTNPG